MILIKRISLLFLLVFAAPIFLFSQERAILDWKFFKNDKPASAKYQAYTWSNVAYKYRPVKYVGTKVEIQFDVTFKMDTAKSYFEESQVFAKNFKLLNHEQGHADIGFIYAMKLKKIFESTSFSRSNYHFEIKNIWTKIFSEMTNEQLMYDIETNHCKNLAAQKKWDLYFERAVQMR